jgi:hypothetical protein
MKHASTRRVFAHWGERRHAELAERDNIDPDALGDALADTFVLKLDADLGHPFRFAGTRLSALFCRDLEGTSFETLWSSAAQAQIRELMSIAAEEATGTVAAVEAQVRNGRINLELLLLPTYCSCNEVRLLGVLAPMTAPAGLGEIPIAGLVLGSLRHIEAAVVLPGIEAAPCVHMRHGFVVYEGGRSGF